MHSDFDRKRGSIPNKSMKDVSYLKPSISNKIQGKNH